MQLIFSGLTAKEWLVLHKLQSLTHTKTAIVEAISTISTVQPNRKFQTSLTAIITIVPS